MLVGVEMEVISRKFLLLFAEFLKDCQIKRIFGIYGQIFKKPLNYIFKFQIFKTVKI